MDKPQALITFCKPKYFEQQIAVLSESGMNMTLFDCVDLFMEAEEDTYVDRKRVYESGEPEKWAAAFVKQFNSHASLTEAVRVLTEALDYSRGALIDAGWGEGSRELARVDAALTTAKELTK